MSVVGLLPLKSDMGIQYKISVGKLIRGEKMWREYQ
jgi:hypothetical protein